MEFRHRLFRALAILSFAAGVIAAALASTGETAHVVRVVSRVATVVITFELLAWRNQAGLIAEQRHQQTIELLESVAELQRQAIAQQVQQQGQPATVPPDQDP
jgi:hypothetical protein